MVAALFQTLDTHFFAMFLYGLDPTMFTGHSENYGIMTCALLTAGIIEYNAFFRARSARLRKPPPGQFFGWRLPVKFTDVSGEIARFRAQRRIKRGRNTKPPIGLGVPHALPPAGVRGVAGVTKPEKSAKLP